MSRHSNWRDCQEWVRYGLPFSTTSNEACKLYDAALTQYVGFYDDQSLGGLLATLEQLEVSDPKNVMSHVISLGLDLVGTAIWPRQDKAFREKLRLAVDLAKGSYVSNWEKQHMKAIELWADGYASAAFHVWDNILIDHPYDLLAAKFAFDIAIYFGKIPERRDLTGRILAQWSKDAPHYGYLMGMYSFSLCETNDTTRAEDYGKQALDLNPWDTWATHALAHTYETENRYSEGINMLDTSKHYWTECGSLACHNFWHWALYNIEVGNYEEAINICDTEVMPRALKGQSSFNLSDISALLFRLELEGQSVADRWTDIYSLCESRLTPDQAAFIDPHTIMACTGAHRTDPASELVAQIQEFSKSGDTDSQKVKSIVGAALCESILAYRQEDFENAVNLLYPVRYDVYQIGGSNAQRDVFNLFLINAALKSSNQNSLARSLILERQQLMNEKSPLTQRFVDGLKA